MRPRDSFFWGAIFVVLGLVLLLVNLGWLAVDVWKVALPVLLIVLGGLTLWAATRPASGGPSEQVEVARGQAEQARLKVRFGAGRLSLTAGAQSANLIDGRFGGGVDLDKGREGPSSVELRVPQSFIGRFFTPWAWWSGYRLDWEVRLNEQVRFDLDVETGASETQIDLRRLQVERFRLSCGASSVQATMPERSGLTRAKIETGAASVVIEIPAGVEAHIRTNAGLAEVKVDTARFPRRAEAYESPGYASAENRIDLEVAAGLASVEVR